MKPRSTKRWLAGGLLLGACLITGWAPDLVKTENRLTFAMLLRI